MHHPSIVEFYRAFAFENYTYVVLELCPNGSLMDMVKARKSLSLPEVRRYMVQLCGGVKYMHQRCVIHRDLKMGNLFIDTHMNIKIGDFGLAAVVVDDKERRQTMCGTPNYIAPELLAKSHASSGHGHKVDTWAIGIICYAMLIGTPPFASKSQTEIYTKLKQLQYEWKEDCQYFIPSQAKHLVTLCLNLVPAERPGMDDIVEHEFFKMGAIAEELDRSCLKCIPSWLEHADPRGDKVTAGYGVDHAAICEASGVGRTLTGQMRPSVGGNVNVSAMAEVHLENAKGCAPVIPMPEGVIYQEFVAAKEDWNTIRKRPLTASKVRSRKEAASAIDTLDMDSLSSTLPGFKAPDSISMSIAPGGVAGGSQAVRQRASVQSFAAQQRQQALPSRALSHAVMPGRPSKQAASTGRDNAQSEQESQKGQPYATGQTKTQTIGRSFHVSQGSLREQPIRAAIRVTRSTSSRGTARDALERDSEKIPVPDGRDGSTENPVTEEEPVLTASTKSSTARGTAARSRPQRENPCREVRVDNSASVRPSSLLSGAESNSMPPQAIDTNDRQPGSAETVSMTSNAGTSKAVSPSSAAHIKAMVIGPADSFTMTPGSSSEEVLKSLAEVYRELSPESAMAASFSGPYHRPPSNPHPVVEKWVDYTDRYGIGYILSDGTAGIALKSSVDKVRSSSCVVIRNAREHYPRRIREEEVQIVPQGSQALPVEFYESFGAEGIRKMQVPATDFRYDDQGSRKWIDGKEVVARLSDQATEEYAAERVRLVGLLDRFGKYMSNLNSSAIENRFEAKTDSFIRFYQRLGNVGIWGFGDGSFQFNFPDHTKLLVYRSGGDDGRRLMLDLYYLQPEDARYLNKYGSMAEGSMEKRDSITCPISEILRQEQTKYVNILTSNQVLQKLSWIRAVVSVWVREGGLGKTGRKKLAWAGLQDEASERDKKIRMVWVTVGREGGDGEVQRRR